MWFLKLEDVKRDRVPMSSSLSCYSNTEKIKPPLQKGIGHTENCSGKRMVETAGPK